MKNLRFFEPFEHFRPFDPDQWRDYRANHLTAMAAGILALGALAFVKAESINAERRPLDAPSSDIRFMYTPGTFAYCEGKSLIVSRKKSLEVVSNPALLELLDC